ncbi:MAG TPA: cysteine--tRNA ligase [Candidatus Saccharimonadales bacterium]|nr:cysteine--tRNA ligase [Candidatus Saccharimonadales bacterium]
MKLFNTLGRKLEDFSPINDNEARIYTCGPTVYDYQHIGNYSGYIYWDVLVRLLKFKGYDVNRVMNITDVGHLVSDADEGEDKLEKGAHREGKTAREVADFYTEDFKKNFKSLNLLEPSQFAKATDYIPQQVEMVQTLIDKGFAYKTRQAIYFDVQKLDDYGKLTGQKLSDKEVGARSEVVTDSAKHHPQDFALWFFTIGRFANHEMHWSSPWGDGFPGWHIECSAIIHAILGDPIDIHTGGVDHIGTHHTNEIAQTEAAFNKPLSRFWLHNNHMMVNGHKISKSLGNGFTLQDLEKRGYSPMDFKMLVLQSHYRSQSNFSWEALEAAKNRLKRFRNFAVRRFQEAQPAAGSFSPAMIVVSKFSTIPALENDLNTPEALEKIEQFIEGVENKSLADEKFLIGPFVKQIDDLFGLDLMSASDISSDEKDLINQREIARKDQDWQKSDELRDKLAEQGIGINDTPQGPVWYRL